MLKTLKDKTLAKSVEIVMNRYLIKEYGEMLQFKLDSERKTIEMEVMLKGETEPLHIKIGRYELKKEGEKTYIRLHDIQTSREWINLVAQDYLEDKAFVIPQNIAKFAEVLI